MNSRSNGNVRTRLDIRRRPATAAAGLIAFGLIGPGTAPAAAKTPGKTFGFFGLCHRVQTLEETRPAAGRPSVVTAPHYDDPKRDRHHPSNLTSSGEWFRANEADNAASPNL